MIRNEQTKSLFLWIWFDLHCGNVIFGFIESISSEGGSKRGEKENRRKCSRWWKELTESSNECWVNKDFFYVHMQGNLSLDSSQKSTSISRVWKNCASREWSSIFIFVGKFFLFCWFRPQQHKLTSLGIHAILLYFLFFSRMWYERWNLPDCLQNCMHNEIMTFLISHGRLNFFPLHRLPSRNIEHFQVPFNSKMKNKSSEEQITVLPPRRDLSTFHLCVIKFLEKDFHKPDAKTRRILECWEKLHMQVIQQQNA